MTGVEGIRAFSYGGGTQSTAALVLAARGEIDYPVFIFANVGEDSEDPRTLEYVEQIAKPFAAMKGIELCEVRKTLRDGSTQTLMDRINAAERSVIIPVRMGKDGAPGNRTCTAEFKIRVVEKELRRRGATPEQKATIGIGISLDEWQRAGSREDPRSKIQWREYPLLDLKLTRDQCREIIRDEGLPLPPRSSCYFCPFHSKHEWQRLARERPDLFDKAKDLELRMYERGVELGRGEFYLTRFGDFLGNVFDGNQETLFEDDDENDATCDTGYCMT